MPARCRVDLGADRAPDQRPNADVLGIRRSRNLIPQAARDANSERVGKLVLRHGEPLKVSPM